MSNGSSLTARGEGPYLSLVLLYPSDILALYETNLDDSIHADYFSWTDYLPLIRKYSIIHMHGLTIYVKEGIPLARWFSLLSALLLLVYRSPSLSLWTVIDSISSNIDEALSINPTACLSFEILIHHKKSISDSGGNYRSRNFLSEIILFRW